MLIRSPKELGLLIMNQRKKLNLSQTELGDLVGLKQKTISALENKPENIRISTLFRVLSTLRFQLELLVKDKNSKKTEWAEEW